MKKTTEQKVKETESKLKELKQKLQEEKSKNNWLDVSDVLGKGYEVEIEVHDKDNSWDDLGLTYGDERLLTYDQCIKLANSKHSDILKMDGSSSKDDFFIDQPFELNKKKGYVAGFCAGSDFAYLYCSGYSWYSYSIRGVRFVRRNLNKK